MRGVIGLKVSLKDEFKKLFKEQLEDFNNELKEKEKIFLTKLIAFEDERSTALSEIEEYKDELSHLTKEYISKAHEELSSIKSQEEIIEEKGKVICDSIEGISTKALISIEKSLETHKGQISSFFEKQQKENASQENSFKEVFSEKTSALHTFLKDRLNSIEKKFMEKNIPIIEKKLQVEYEKIEQLRENINSEKEILMGKLKDFEDKEKDAFSSLEIEKNQLEKQSEERFANIEHLFDEKMSEYSSKFSEFKEAVINQIQGLMSDVDAVVGEKIKNIELYLSSANSDASKIRGFIKEIGELKSSCQNYTKDITEQINNLQHKVGDISLEADYSHIKHFVYTMSGYEKKLLSLISTLKLKGIADYDIEHILVSKGHPRFYVKTILTTYEELYK